jgi:hypothetical protein
MPIAKDVQEKREGKKKPDLTQDQKQEKNEI